MEFAGIKSGDQGGQEIIFLLRTNASQPLLKHDQAEQQLVIILAARTMLFQKGAHGFGSQLLVHERILIEQEVRKHAFGASIEPTVHNIDGETALLPKENGRRKQF